MLTISGRTHAGLVRRVNEDRMTWDSDLSLFAIADGMGGHNAGEVAARIALEVVESFLGKSARGDDFTWPFGVDTSLSFAANRLVTAARLANRLVFRAADERAEYLGMGTTLVAGLVDDSRFTFVSVGDSRVYLMNGSELRQLSRDDSWLVMIGAKGAESASAKNHPMQHVLTSAIGASPEIDVTPNEFELADGQRILLCTDGLHDALTDDQICSIMSAERDSERVVDRLLEAALERDGGDNITVLVAQFRGPSSSVEASDGH